VTRSPRRHSGGKGSCHEIKRRWFLEDENAIDVEFDRDDLRAD
jgi:hypothetical protein